MKKILITGNNSFLGTSLLRYLTEKGDYEIENIDLRDGGWNKVDISNYDSLFYVAGIAHLDTYRNRNEKEKYYSVNTRLAIEVAKKAKADGIKQFIFVSSIIIYGRSTRQDISRVITKDTRPRPENYYGLSKLEAEKGIRELEDDSFKVCIIRSPMVYGEHCKGNYPKLRNVALKINLFPYIANQRSMIYVGNLMEFIRLMIENEERGIFYPQNLEYVNTSELVKTIALCHGRNIKLVKGFGRMIRLLSRFSGTFLRVFGNMTIDMELSEYKNEYRFFDFNESVKRTESKWMIERGYAK